MKKTLAIILTIILTITGAIFANSYSNEETIDTLDSLMEIIKSSYYKEVDEGTLIRGAIDGMFNTLDPHSSYMNPEEFKELTAFTSGEFGVLVYP